MDGSTSTTGPNGGQRNLGVAIRRLGRFSSPGEKRETSPPVGRPEILHKDGAYRPRDSRGPTTQSACEIHRNRLPGAPPPSPSASAGGFPSVGMEFGTVLLVPRWWPGRIRIRCVRWPHENLKYSRTNMESDFPTLDDLPVETESYRFRFLDGY